MKKIVLVTGGFDPVHGGHLDYLRAASELGDRLIVGVNSDEWLRRKKGREFMGLHDRIAVMQSIRYVDQVITFDDTDGTAIDAIRRAYDLFLDEEVELIFANGGDRGSLNTPEMSESYAPHVPRFVHGVGGDKKTNSSSLLLTNWTTPYVMKPWGSYRVLFETPGFKVKELVVLPNQTLSMQRHHLRKEYWFVVEGNATVRTFKNENEGLIEEHLGLEASCIIEAHEWHQLSNPYHTVVRILEVQVGNLCVEEDIERLA